MAPHLPLPTLLSQTLVAFTIEFDNEAEHRIPHWTTNHGSKSGLLDAPWLVSLAMYENCMRFVGEKGVTVRALEEVARTTTNLRGMERWGYVTVQPDPADSRSKPRLGDWLIRATPAGRMAQDIWRPLFGEIEKRWQERFGEQEIRQLREALLALIRQFDVDLPNCLPILGYGLFSAAPHQKLSPAGHAEDDNLPLSALLSKALLAFAVDYEREPGLSLAMSANFLRVLNENGVRTRDLARISGAAKELSKNSLGFLAKQRYLVIEPDPTAKSAKIARLTLKGRQAQDAYLQRLTRIEERWQERFGKEAIRKLRESLERLVGEPTAVLSPLFRGLEPYPDGWRAAVPKPETLPHYPMVTHRGGYPDGS